MKTKTIWHDEDGLWSHELEHVRVRETEKRRRVSFKRGERKGGRR